MLTSGIAHYKRNIFISVIICGVAIIFASLYLPKKFVPDKKILYEKPLTLLQEISQTVKNVPVQSKKPDTSHTYIQDTVRAYKLPEDVRRNLKVANQNPDENSKSIDQTKKIPEGLPVEKGNNSPGSAEPAKQITPPLQSMPRLIYEEVPAAGENKFNGELQLSLKIDENGQVVDHRILSNSLDCTDCLNAIIQAAYKSKWEPAVVDGKKTAYWVEKSYIFN